MSEPGGSRSVVSPTLSPRQQALLGQIRSSGRGDVEGLARSFDVTPQTIRRDLGVLCRLRLLLRVHGGAVAPGGVSQSDQLVNIDYDTRRLLGFEAKLAIGRLASRIIPNDASLFINIGTTTEQVANNLVNHLGLFVISNNINITNTLRRCESMQVMTAGGLVRRDDGGIVGDATEDFVNQFKVDYAVIGCSGIEEDGTVLEFDIREVRVTRAMISNARSVILVADGSKFERKAPVRLGNVGQLDHVVTDRPPSRDFAAMCREHGVNVSVVNGKD